ncbi:hypothetical protein [Dysgonomonas gadei]|uniref:Uncharacterized protein n=1 Tax=Dysgonomonas gadei ATCC BAA-286 TaxID=742766 RepID=F5J179_9BACT|nr:hypothetical protein [Dysgonomonas gadei]EGK00453.1 hypothetical protein HMPREF9455_03096 [Dysgonomonas gadei ATCC BAA-286]
MSKKTRQPVGYIKPDSSTTVEIYNGNRGIASKPGVAVLTFEIQGVEDREDIRFSESRSTYQRYVNDRLALNLGGYSVPIWGHYNLYPQEIFSMVSENKLLPEVIEKQVKFMFGKGPRLYREIITGEGEKQKRVRIPVEDQRIQDWLDSWEEMGYQHLWEYLKNIITDFYHVKTCVSKYNFNVSRRINGPLPIAALTYVGSDEARLAMKGAKPNRSIKNEDCKYVIVGDWLNITASEYDVWHRFDPRTPLKYSPAISFTHDKTFTKWVYALNSCFKGLKEYLKASELAPKYLNSYLRNALNAHIHVQIPGSWYEQHKIILQQICSDNLMRTDVPLQTEYRGVKLVGDDGKALPFYESMMDELISCELRRITSLMSGEGKNQGKLYATTKWGEEGWKFEEFPGKFKEFFDTVLKYEEYANKAILTGKGVPSSISNVDGSGIISKSGSEAYYNYLLYVMTLTLDEYFVLKDLNRAIHINFPHAKKEGIKAGFWIDIPAKLQETTPDERPEKTATADQD